MKTNKRRKKRCLKHHFDIASTGIIVFYKKNFHDSGLI